MKDNIKNKTNKEIKEKSKTDKPSKISIESIKTDEKIIPKINTALRQKIVEVPKVICEASGIIIKGRRIKSILFSTDVSIIRNTNADAVIAVYPFTPELIISKAILDVASVPVFCGVGGGLTSGKRSVEIAFSSESFGAHGVVVNSPTPVEVIEEMNEKIDIPIIITVTSLKDNYLDKIKAGASIINVSGANKTAQIVRDIRKHLGDEFPIIATGGPTDEFILETIKAGANAITYTPPSNGELFSKIMESYRK